MLKDVVALFGSLTRRASELPPTAIFTPSRPNVAKALLVPSSEDQPPQAWITSVLLADWGVMETFVLVTVKVPALTALPTVSTKNTV
jgi:hypothetical protein